MPLSVLHISSAEAQTLYAASRVLIRPDHHVAWRGEADADPAALLAMVCARPLQAAQTI